MGHRWVRLMNMHGQQWVPGLWDLLTGYIYAVQSCWGLNLELHIWKSKDEISAPGLHLFNRKRAGVADQRQPPPEGRPLQHCVTSRPWHSHTEGGDQTEADPLPAPVVLVLETAQHPVPHVLQGNPTGRAAHGLTHTLLLHTRRIP